MAHILSFKGSGESIHLPKHPFFAEDCVGKNEDKISAKPVKLWQIYEAISGDTITSTTARDRMSAVKHSGPFDRMVTNSSCELQFIRSWPRWNCVDDADPPMLDLYFEHFGKMSFLTLPKCLGLVHGTSHV